MTDTELHELFALIDTLGVRPCEKRAAIDRLLEKRLVQRIADRGIELTPAALSALGKMKAI